MCQVSTYRQFQASFAASMGAITAGSCISWISEEQHRREHRLEEAVGKFNEQFLIFFLVASSSAFLSYFFVRWRGPLLVLRVGAVLTLFIWVLAIWVFMVKNPFHTTIYLFAIICGMNTAPMPLYIGEISHRDVRGAFVSLICLNIKIGVLMADVSLSYHKDYQSKILCYVSVLVSLLQIVLLFQLNEAPFFLMLQGDEYQAGDSLIWLQGDEYDVSEDLDKMDRNVDEYRDNQFLDTLFIFFQKRRILLILFSLAIFHQCTGTTSSVLISTYVYGKSMNNGNEYQCYLINGASQITAILISLMLVDKIGRRPLLIASSVGVSISVLALGICITSEWYSWLTLTALFMQLTMFAFGYGPVFWIMVSELFPADCKILGCTFSVGLFWLCRVLIECIQQTFNRFGVIETDYRFGYLFIIFGIVTLFGLVFILFSVPESKRKTFAEIEEIFK